MNSAFFYSKKVLIFSLSYLNNKTNKNILMVSFTKEFEDYVLSNKNPQTLKSLVPGLEHQRFIEIFSKLNNLNEQSSTKDVHEVYDDIQNLRIKNGIQLDDATTILLLKEFDIKSTSEERKKEILKEIKNNLNFSVMNYYNFDNRIDIPANHESNDIQMKNTFFSNNDSISDSRFCPDIFDAEKLTKESIGKFKYNLANKTHSFLLDYVSIDKQSDDFIKFLLIEKKLKIELWKLSDDEIKRIAEYFNKTYDAKSTMSDLSELNLQEFTLSQLELLESHMKSINFNPNHITNIIIQKKFYSELQELNNSPKNKADLLKQIIDYTKKKNRIDIEYELIIQLLELNHKEFNFYDYDLFIEYLKNPRSYNSDIFNFDKKTADKIISQKRVNICEFGFLSSNIIDSLIENYIKYFFFNTDKTIKDFEKYINSKYLEKYYHISKVYKGIEEQDTINYLKDKYQGLVNEIKLDICSYNKRKFDLGEDISIDVDLKNVTSVFVNIYEVNTESYYRTNQNAIPNSLSVEGLIATYEQTFIFNEKPQKIFNRKFNLEKIKNKRGVFIIEFIGNGRTSRALIKVGSLSLMSRVGGYGKMFFMLNEKCETLKKDETIRRGIWFKDTFYSAKLDDGVIIIPYSKTSSQGKAIIVDGDFSEICEIEIPDEKYFLKGTFIANNESALMGNNMKVLFKPQLFANDRIIPLIRLKKSKITVNITKIENHVPIPILYIFDNIVVSDAQETVVEFQIPPKMSSLNLTFEAEIGNKSKQSNEKLMVNKNFTFDIEDQENQCVTVLLTKDSNNNSYLQVLGKNGEPKQKIYLKIISTHILNCFTLPEINLTTDDNGIVCLGNISDYCSNISVSFFYYGDSITKKFDLQFKENYNYPEKLDLLENEEIQLPLKRSTFPTENHTLDFYVALLKHNKNDRNNIIADLSKDSSFLDYKPYQDSTDNSGKIIIKNLTAGNYKLLLRTLNKEISITVHKGRTKGLNFIETDTDIVENSEHKNPISIESCKLNYENKKVNEIKIKLNEKNINGRVHVFAYNYIGKDSISKDINSIYSSATKHSNNKLTTWKNIYQSNIILSEELQYVLERKNQERFLGNNLEKPSLIMKRKFVRDTTTNDEVLDVGTKFNIPVNDILKNEMAKKMMDKTLSSVNMLTSFYNFLLNPAKVFANCFPNNDNEVIIKDASLDDYALFEIVAVDEKGSCQKLISSDILVREVKENKVNNNSKDENSLIIAAWPKTKNLTLETPLPQERCYSEERKIESYGINEKIIIPDVATVSFKIIDSIEKFISCHNSINKSIVQEWEKLGLTKLEELKENELLEKIEQNFSHEFNLFLYFRYPELFEKYILPVLKYKANKTFIDLFLLDDLDTIEKLMEFPQYIEERLNMLEKILLIKKLYSNENYKDKCCFLADKIYKEAFGNKHTSEKEKQLINIVMNMKTDDKTSDIQENKQFLNQNNIMARNIDTFSNRNCFQTSQINMNCNFAANMDFGNSSSQQRLMPMQNAISYGEPSIRIQKLARNSSFTNKGEAFCRKEDDYSDNDENDCFDDIDYCEEEDDIIQDILNQNKLRKDNGTCQEYIETQYLFSNSPYIEFSNNMFWADYCKFITGKTNLKEFNTRNILYSFTSISEFIIAIAVLKLPYSSITHDYIQNKDRSLEIKLNSNAILFTKEIVETEYALKENIIVSQMVFDPRLNEDIEDKEDAIKEYLVNRIYEHKTIVTNITSEKIDFELLIQIPEGSIPVKKNEYIEARNSSLNNFFTDCYKSYFYFPQVGTYTQTGPSVSVDGKVISKGEKLTYKVIKYQKTVIKTSISNILETGTKKDVLDYFNSAVSIKDSDINQVLKFANDKEFYTSLIKILRKHCHFNYSLWELSFKHNDLEAIKELIQDFFFKNPENRFINNDFNCSLLKINKSNNFKINSHLDYDPVLNSRVHRLGDNKIPNKELRETYEKLIMKIIRYNDFSNKARLQLTYYLILQDRIEEANNIFKQIDYKELLEKEEFVIQYDYITAYLDISTGFPEFTKAKQICGKYKNFPLLYWREYFEEIEDQLIQYLGQETEADIDKIVNENRKAKLESEKVNKETPSINFKTNDSKLVISYSNASEIKIKLYLIDIEIMFSSKPFLKTDSSDFSFVKPNYIESIPVEKSIYSQTLTYEIKKELVNKNLFIEVNCFGVKKFDIYFSNSLNIEFSQNIGEIKVSDQKQNPLQKVYIKCFAEMKDGKVSFYKDGYTDLRGRFNYVSLNTNEISNVKKFSILVNADDLGAVIKEVTPPENIKASSNETEYQAFQNLKQEVKTLWRSKNKI